MPVGERALWWIQHYLHHVRSRLLVNPHCKGTVHYTRWSGRAGTERHYQYGQPLDESLRAGYTRKLPPVPSRDGAPDAGERRRPAVDTGDASVESTQIYTQVSVRALQVVHASTHPAENKSRDDNMANNHHNDNKNDTAQGNNDVQHHPLPDR